METPEARLDQLEAALRTKVETMTGFADETVKERYLEKVFRFFDYNESGHIDFDEFFAAMTRLNFVGVQRELEALFDRYDDDCSGTLEYSEFAKHLFGLAMATSGAAASKSVVERVKSRILEMGGANGIRTMTCLLRRMDKDGSKNLDRTELAQGLAALGLGNVEDTPGGDLDRLMDFFDRDRNGRIDIEEFHRGIRGNMSRRRKLLVREAFKRLDRTGDGRVTIDDLASAYDASSHPDVAAGRMTPEQALRDLLGNYERNSPADGVVTWAEYLDYYKDLSCGIESDDYFELMMRNAWHISGGQGSAANTSCRRVLVTHTDGREEVIEVENDLGISGQQAIQRQLEKQGVHDIAKVAIYA